MTLEDFFTLTEMKDGLTAPSRVEELVTLMKSEKDSSVNNAGELTRQWVAVTSTIAATENKDCLDLFIQLDGLLFVDKWLKDVQNLVNDANESFVEDSITALLRALEKLHIDNKRSVSTGIWSTVERLLDHKSLKVQDIARLLFDSWKQDGNAVDHVENTEVLCGGGNPELPVQETKPSALNSTPSEVGSNIKNHLSCTAQDETLEGLQSESADVQTPTLSQQSPAQKFSENEDVKSDRSPEPLGSVILEAIQQSSIKDEPSACSLGADAIIGSTDFPVAKMSNPDDSKLNEMPSNEKQKHTVNSSPKNLGVTDISSVSGPLESGVCSDSPAATSPVFVDDSALQKSSDANEDGFCQKLDPLSGDGQDESCRPDPQIMMDDTMVVTDGTSAMMGDSLVVMDDTISVDHCNTAVQDSDCSNVPRESSSNGNLSRKVEDIEAPTRMDDSDAVDEDEDEEQDSDEGNELTIASAFPINIFEKRRADIDVEYGMVDALEVARQVAQEVEREVEKEVVDYGEPYCSSSSGKMSGGGLRQPGSPDSINEKQDPVTEVAPKHVPVEQVNSVEANPEKDVVVSKHQDMVREHSIHDMESSQVTEMAQEPEVNSEKGLCGFDLNEEVSSDEMDSVNPVSTQIPFSRPPPAADLPVAPLQFEGAIGLKDSLGNSAFRRASPRRFSDSEKNLSTGATTGSSKQRPDYMCLDLNVALGGDDLEKQIPLSSGLPSGESSGEVSQSRLGRPNLDLNRIDDDGDAPLNLRVEGQFLYNRNARRSPSPASSSSSMQPLMRNFDLNDRPFFLNDSSDQGHGKPSQSATAYRGQVDGSVISILGTRVEIKRNDVSQTLSLSNGKGIIETAGDPNLARAGSLLELGSGVSYTNSPIFGYNGLATGPPMSFSPTMYGPGGTIPYMMDSRGSHVVPQVMGSASVVPPPFPQSPFIVNMNAMQPGLNGAGPSRPSLDLNSGFMVESANRDTGLRHLFIHGQGGSMDEHLRNSSQPPSSNVGGKRKEPESGWEPYPFSYRHQQPPWR
ncbi:uncharacterized protein LOC126783541 [Argentina anserina]|uniref:uncharacterized protein LOC126783541 n=1 Tax=Argentina anserina TaxID=57926 RepID=UPI002176506B|nr:uncharacterized protein LOC126783541 [Potentilla anserina]